jgi:hypothetical protein
VRSPSRNGVLDLFPPCAEHGWRLRLEEGRLAAIQAYDPRRSAASASRCPSFSVGATSELVLPWITLIAPSRPRGLVHYLPAFGARSGRAARP